MANVSCFLLLFLSGIVLIPTTHQLQTYQSQVLLQLRKHLEYPTFLDIWVNYTGDVCNAPPSPQLSITCQDTFITELRIMGDKRVKVRDFDGHAIPNQTLSETFSVDSFVTTLTRLTTLRVLSLVSLGIWGPLPEKIHRLSSLQLLDLSSNFLFGPIPSQISRLARLQILTLDGNYFNGGVPDGLDSMSDLTVLTLKNNQLSGRFPSSISRIKTLSTVALSKNEMSGKLPDLGALSSLHLLDLIDNHFDSDLPNLPKGLVTVLLSRNSFSGDIPEQYGELGQLQHLDLSFNFLTGMPPQALFSLPNISYLDLSSNMFSGSLPGSLHCGSKLGFVDISNNKFIGELPSCLGTTSAKPVVKFSGNCLSVDVKHQHRESYCKAPDARRKHFLGRELGVSIAIICGATLVIVLLALGLVIFCRKVRSRETFGQHDLPKVVQENAPTGMSAEFLANARFISETAKIGTQSAPSYRLFSLEELKDATNNFAPPNLMGDGSTGKLYRGRLENGAYVAIRSIASLKKHSVQNLRVRLDLLSKLHHPHLVGLLGHCVDGRGQDESSTKVFLIYEYVVNGNYRTHLTENSLEKVLNWSDRLAILIGVAKAVHFLHTGIIPSCFNNRLKTNNILLDEHQIAKLSDYGMSILTDDFEKSDAKGEGLKTGQKTNIEDDVYNFGFILLESLVGTIVSGKGEAFLLNEMASFGSQDGRRRIVDPIVLTTCSQESLSIVVAITNKCISPDLSARPSFEDVLWNLQYAAQVQAAYDTDQKSDTNSQS
ncbi:probable inactive leucine-rich repeat receptor-like protein kinase At3g03770 [Rhodamnia argentea]|uniref:Probable inactive leucine-rich repeat receptor-like protein kinase At3g03770 n=1 Tax=Rhodamnia argentea TaxID=178133 RepID=A0A8B8QDM3_9MYRT|nr:probable inactive leucine-rich repeat receptor-like protein kinase At3g03770 [Rhodamnia argentea]